MTLAIRVQFLHGILRAGSADDLAITGLSDPGEWPPSPARLFSALVAAGGTGGRCAVGDGSELEWLEAAEPPLIVADPAADVLRSTVRERFVVVDDLFVEQKKTPEGERTRETRAVHEYIGRISAIVRPGTRMAPKVPDVIYVWPALSPSPEQLDCIAARASRVSYLGCSDSPVRITVSTAAPPEQGDHHWVPDDKGDHSIPVPYAGFTHALDGLFEQWLNGPVRRAWLPTRRVRYAGPGEAPGLPPLRPTTLWFLLDPPVSGRFSLALAETLRAATLDLYQRFVGADVPAVIHGHGFSNTGRNHAQFLALPDVGFPHSSGRIHGVAVWLPSDTEADTVANLRLALAHLKTLVRRGWFETAVRPHGGEPRPWAGSPTRWAGPSSRWVSALPVVHERWSASGPQREEVERWFRHAGFECRVLDYRSSTVPLLPGSVRLHPDQVHRKGRGRYPYSFFDVRLDRKIDGPVVIGRGRQFGMGLMAPQG
jgi:CRISPR-associated protein Csb2